MPTFDDLFAFAAAHNWSAVFLAVASVLLWVVVRLSKDDAWPPWFSIPSRLRPLLAIGLGAAAGALYKAAADGVSWKQGLWLGVSAGVGAVLIQVFGVDVLRGGKEMPIPKSLSIRPPPPPSGSGPVPGSGTDDTKPATPPPAMKRVIALAMLVALAPATLGCSLLHSAVPVLDDVIAYVTDAEQVLAVLESIAQLFFLAHPDPTLQQEYVRLDKRVHLSLDASVRLAHAGKDLDSSDMQAAVADFQAAWNDLQQFASAHGIAAPPTPKLGAGEMPQPMLMTVHRAEKK